MGRELLEIALLGIYSQRIQFLLRANMGLIINVDTEIAALFWSQD